MQSHVQLACIVLDLSYLENIDLLARKNNLLPYYHPLFLSQDFFSRFASCERFCFSDTAILYLSKAAK